MVKKKRRQECRKNISLFCKFEWITIATFERLAVLHEFSEDGNLLTNFLCVQDMVFCKKYGIFFLRKGMHADMATYRYPFPSGELDLC